MDSIKDIRKAAEQGDAEAQYRLGIWYYDGGGKPHHKNECYRPGGGRMPPSFPKQSEMPHDWKASRVKAINWFRKAAEQGHADAQFILGFCYDQGFDIEEDSHEAAKWLLQAAIQGHKLAKMYLGPKRYEIKKNFWYACRHSGVHLDKYGEFLSYLKLHLPPNTKDDKNDLTSEENFSLYRIEDMIGFQKIKEEAQKFEKQAQKQTERCNFAMVLCGILLVLGFFIMLISRMHPWGAIVLWGFLAILFWTLIK